jgi:hypothetical protein
MPEKKKSAPKREEGKKVPKKAEEKAPAKKKGAKAEPVTKKVVKAQPPAKKVSAGTLKRPASKVPGKPGKLLTAEGWKRMMRRQKVEGKKKKEG